MSLNCDSKKQAHAITEVRVSNETLYGIHDDVALQEHNVFCQVGRPEYFAALLRAICRVQYQALLRTGPKGCNSQLPVKCATSRVYDISPRLIVPS